MNGATFRYKIRAGTNQKNDYLANEIEQNIHVNDTNTTKQHIIDIRRKWKNEHIHIITNEIREGQ